MAKRKSKAATALNLMAKHRKVKATQEQITEAARALGKLRAKNRKSLAEAGKKGAQAFWGSMTAEERRIEARRRALVRKKNRRATIAAKLEAERLDVTK